MEHNDSNQYDSTIFILRCTRFIVECSVYIALQNFMQHSLFYVLCHGFLPCHIVHVVFFNIFFAGGLEY